MTKQTISRTLLAATVANCAFQIFWFARTCIHQIDIDGIDYIGIARHLRNHEFHASINAFRSPLISWLIAAGSLFTSDLLRIGKLLNAGSFLLCVILLYVFTRQLWHSRLAASLAALLFSLARGLTAVSVEMVTPDFLLAAFVLVYFIVLLQCLRRGDGKYWLLLGALHAVAFMAKGFALPWLAISSVLAVLLSSHRKQFALRLILAGILPFLVAATWAGVLHSKYGSYTTGTQFKVNLLQWTFHAYPDRTHGRYSVLTDTQPFIDEDHVDDPMPPGSWPWHYQFTARDAVKGLAFAELHNLPKAAKELLILVTPAGPLAFVAVVVALTRRRKNSPAEFAVAAIVIFAILSLIFAYCLLVFDGRYLYPIVPLLLAVAAGFALEKEGPAPHVWRGTVLGFAAFGVVFTALYAASPFRQLRHDSQVLCYRAGAILRAHPGTTVISIGSGPYPEHGVGWEAGYKSAYFGDRRLIAATDKLPDASHMQPLLHDISLAAPDAILVWGHPGDPQYQSLVQRLLNGHAERQQEIADPAAGPVGTMIVLPQPLD